MPRRLRRAAISRVVDDHDAGDGGSSNRKYSRMAAPHVWCQVMSPNGRIGWVRGKHEWLE